MSKVRIITERVTSLSYAFAKKQNIYLFPVNIIKGEEVFKDSNDEEGKKFIEEMESFEEIPSTAVPAPGEMKQILLEAVKETKKGIYISASSKLSGLHSLGVKVADELNKEGYDIRVFDSYTTVSMEGMFAYQASVLSEQGKDIDEIMTEMERIKEDRLIVEYGVLETLKYLEKGGRIGKAKAWMANLFSFKPIISAKEGLLEPVAKVRTNPQGLDLVVDKIKADIERTGKNKLKVMFDYGVNEEYVREEVEKRILDEFDAEIVSYNQISIAIASHLGPSVWGVCVMME